MSAMDLSTKKIVLLFLFLVCFLNSCNKESKEPVVAKVDDRIITASEFRTRFAVTPYFGQFPDDPQVKTLAMASMIGEKLLAEEAERKKLDQTDRYRIVFREMEKEAVIEELLHRMFADIEVSPEEVRRGFEKSKRVLEVEELVFDNEEEAMAFKNKLTAGQALEKFGASKYTIKWGDSDPNVEEVLWNLQMGEISEPIEFKNHIYLFRVASEQSSPHGSQSDYLQKAPVIRKVLSKRKKQKAYEKFFHEMMAGKQTKVPAEIMTYIAEQLEEAWEIPSTTDEDSTFLQPALMTDSDYRLAAARLTERLNEKFITFDDGSYWTIGDFLGNLRYGPYPLNYSSKAAFRASLRNMSIMMMEQEYVAKEGYRKGLDKTYNVKNEVRQWMDSFLADQMRMQFMGEFKGEKENHSEADVSVDSGNGAVHTASTGHVKFEAISAFDDFLTKAAERHTIEINKPLLDTLRVHNLKMVVLKTHFPGRQAAPEILPLDKLQNYFAKIYHKFN